MDKRAELALKGGDEALTREALKQKRRVMKDAENAEQGAQRSAEPGARDEEELERMGRSSRK